MKLYNGPSYEQVPVSIIGGGSWPVSHGVSVYIPDVLVCTLRISILVYRFAPGVLVSWRIGVHLVFWYPGVSV